MRARLSLSSWARKHMTRTKPRDVQHHGFRFPGLTVVLVFLLLTYYRGLWIGCAGTLVAAFVLDRLQRWIELRFTRSVRRWAAEKGLTDVDPPSGPGLVHYEYGLWTFSDTRRFQAQRPNGRRQGIIASYYAPCFGLYLDVLCGWD